MHTENQLEKITEHIDMVGVNNRDLETFEVSIENSVALAQKLPSGIVKISESGIQSAGDIKILRQAGYQGFLIGELFMKTRQPAQTCKKFIEEINTKTK
jgi:indole-3-glycerol phosphate synthase